MKNIKYQELRDKYNTIIYHDYHLSQDLEKISIEYDFEIVGLERFKPQIIIFKKNLEKINPELNLEKIDLEDPILRNLAFNFGMEDLINYFKLTCPRNILIECGYLDKNQEDWFKKLYINGLGEFFYINNIDFPGDDFIKFSSNKNLKFENLNNKKELKGNLVPVGGGKDSCVTLDVLEKIREQNATFIVETNFYIGAPNNVVKEADYEESTIYAKRILDKKMFDLNKQGFLNGHTPFSAMLAFLTNMVAYIAGKKYVVLSNESSANEPTVKDTKINHQYSKSIELENDFRWYVDNYLKTNVEYFSLLRPLTEIQIAKLFVKTNNFRKSFKSCNAGSREDKWCCNCPKCLFVYIMLSPFVSDDELDYIFGENLYEKEELKNIFIELIGKGKTKPFECVGTVDEINFALCKKIQLLKDNNIELPKLLDIYLKEIMNSDMSKIELYIEENENKLMNSYNEENNLNDVFEELLKSKLNEG